MPDARAALAAEDVHRSTPQDPDDETNIRDHKSSPEAGSIEKDEPACLIHIVHVV